MARFPEVARAEGCAAFEEWFSHTHYAHIGRPTILTAYRPGMHDLEAPMAELNPYGRLTIAHLAWRQGFATASFEKTMEQFNSAESDRAADDDATRRAAENAESWRQTQEMWEREFNNAAARAQTRNPWWLFRRGSS